MSKPGESVQLAGREWPLSTIQANNKAFNMASSQARKLIIPKSAANDVLVTLLNQTSVRLSVVYIVSVYRLKYVKTALLFDDYASFTSVVSPVSYNLRLHRINLQQANGFIRKT